MNYLFLAIAYSWNNWGKVFVPAIVFPIIAFVWSFGQPTVFSTNTTLRVSTEFTESPLLNNMHKPWHNKMLKKLLVSNSVVKEAEKKTGISINRKNLDFIILDDIFIQLKYSSTEPEGLERLMDIVATSFIHEVLSPERFRNEKELQEIEGQIKSLNKNVMRVEKEIISLKKSIISVDNKGRIERKRRLSALIFQKNKSETQLKLAKREYERKLVFVKFSGSEPSADGTFKALWFFEPTVMEDSLSRGDRHIRLIKYAFYLGVMFGFLLLIIIRLMDTSLKTDEEIAVYLNSRILGHVPALGKIHIARDGITAGDNK